MGRRQGQTVKPSSGQKNKPKRPLPSTLKRPVAPIVSGLAGNQATNTALKSGAANKTEGQGAIPTMGALRTGAWTPLQPLKPPDASPFFTATDFRQQQAPDPRFTSNLELAGADQGFRFAKSNAPVTEEGLADWAMHQIAQGTAPEKVSLQLYASGEVTGGSLNDLRDAKATIDRNLPQWLAKRQAEQIFQQQEHEDALKREAERKKAAEIADYNRRGTRLAPMGYPLISQEEGLKAEAAAKKEKPLRAYSWHQGGRPRTFTPGQTRGHYTIISPSKGIVQKDGRYYYANLNESDLDRLMYGNTWEDETFLEDVAESTEGINVVSGYALKGVAFALQFAPALGRFASPFIGTAGEGMLHGVRAAQARRRGDDFDEPAPDVNLRTVAAGAAGAFAPKIGEGIGGLASKAITPLSKTAAPVVGAVTQSVGTQYASQVIEKTPDLIEGKASLSSVVTPDTSVLTGIAQDLAIGQAQKLAGNVADKIAPGRTLKTEASTPGTPTHEAPPLKPGAEPKPPTPRPETPTTPAGAAKPEPKPAPRPTGRIDSGKGEPKPLPKRSPTDHPDFSDVSTELGHDPPSPRPAPKPMSKKAKEAQSRIRKVDNLKKAAGTLGEVTVPFDPRYSGPEWNHIGGGQETGSSRRNLARWTKKHGRSGGIDFIVENRKTGRLVIGEQKAVSDESFTSTTATTINLEKNLGWAITTLKASIKQRRVHPDEIAHLEQTIGRLEATQKALHDRQPLPDGVAFELTNVGGKGSQIGKDHVRLLGKVYGDRPDYVEYLLRRTFIRDPELAAGRNRPKGGARGTDADPDIVPARDVLTPDAQDELARLHSGKSDAEWKKEKADARAAEKQEAERARQEKAAKRKADQEARAAEKQQQKEQRAEQRQALRQEKAKAKQQAADQRKNDRRQGKGAGQDKAKAVAPPGEETPQQTGTPDRSGAEAQGADEGTKRPAGKSRSKPRGSGGSGAPPASAPPLSETPEIQRAQQKKTAGPTHTETPAQPVKPTVKKPTKRAPLPRAEDKEPGAHAAKPGAQAEAKPAVRKPDEEAGGGQRRRSARSRGAGQPEKRAGSAAAAPGTTEELRQGSAPAAVSRQEQSPKAAKSKAKAAVPEHTQPIVRDPGAAPTRAKAPKPARPPSSRGEKVTGALGKADAVLGAVRDYQQYKADGASDATALARSGTTLAANLKGGPAAAIVNAANAYDNARGAGQGKLEATATALGTAGGGIIASKVAPAGPVGTAVNLANTAAQALGAPQGVQDATTGAAALVPSNIISTTVTEGARSYANLGTALVTGDTKALDKQVQGFQAGSAGPWLQGYAQMTGMVADVAAGDNFETALNKAAATGKGSWADRVGSKGGDALYELGESKEAKSGKYGASVQGVSMAVGITSDLIAGESFEQALNKAAQAGKGSWPDKVGSALGDAAWDATEKTRQLVNEGLPAAKQAIKNKWHKLWS